MVNECKSAVHLEHFCKHAHIQTTHSVFHPPTHTHSPHTASLVCLYHYSHMETNKRSMQERTKALTHTDSVCVFSFSFFFTFSSFLLLLDESVFG